MPKRCRWIHAVALVAISATAACARPIPQLRIDGSAGVAPLVQALATEFGARNRGATPTVASGLGASARLQAVAEGRIDVAMASHGIDIEQIRAMGLTAHEIARTAVVFAVHRSVPITALTRQQLCDLYARRVRDWQELGGPTLPVVSLTRPAGEVDADVAQGAVPCLRDAAQGATRVVERADDMAAQLAATAGAIGITSRTYVDQSGGRMGALSLDGVEPSASNVESGAYGLVRRSYLVTKAAPSPAVQRFLQFVGSPEGTALIRANGAVPARD